MSDAFIRVEHLTKRYGDLVVLNNVSIEIAKGEFVALLGPSGCGKTTLLRSIAGFIDIEEGDVSIDGRSMKKLPPNRRPVNTVFQNYALFPHLTVAQNVAFGPRRAGVDRKAVAEIVDEALATVGMAGYADRFPSQLSGGQQQRVALARAIANKPKVLLLDEPLGALDLKLRKQMQIELKALQQKLGMTFIFVTHDQEEALVMADRIAVMNSGRIAQIGRGREIYHAPTERYVADFIGDANLITCKVSSARTLVSEMGGLEFDVSHSAPVGADVTYLLRPEAIGVAHGPTPAAEGLATARAKVRDVVFVGNATRIYAEAEGGQVFVAQQPALVGDPEYSRGETVTLSWRRDSGQVLTR
ncbi:ABC transporter ATP-binding protein [Microvirga makkahensis]|uniref:Spermidine/putrescine import ATP-binding protein PotA n=1 Tax=Microvirga makkahensis TaxID=1128670 RepID=A0A7X3MUK7_9HYPH|nr:ABC transporter ATP-binding protein [Microvirga makkahensis]MXQ13523.1 polyamine ABC transporter ATP-binding protein [Microvirga makkahensis]